MKVQWGFYLAIFAAPAMLASTIDVSADISTVVHHGDTLVFCLATASFAVNAAQIGLPPGPTDMQFTLFSAPLSAAGEFTATLESADGAVSQAFGNISFGAGDFQGRGYSGVVSTLHGDLRVSADLWGTTFRDSHALLALRNQGSDVTIGLAPYLLRQDLFASLSGGPLTVGAVPERVDLEVGENRVRLTGLRASRDRQGDLAAPEPSSGGMFFGGGVLLCGLSGLLARVRRRG